jgi:hypothetical protein
MAHFAELDTNNIVTRVIVVADADCLDSNGQESEAVGAAFCTQLLGGRWVQTSYNAKRRQRYAAIGDLYDASFDAFIAPKPFASWGFDRKTCQWQAPRPRPQATAEPGCLWTWNETAKDWQQVKV